MTGLSMFYDRSLKMLKVNVKLHANPEALKGDIFLCNHFSRFETLIPQFLIYEETGGLFLCDCFK